MHDAETLTVWFSFAIAGMILTIVMIRGVSESLGSGVTQGESEGFPTHQGLHERASSMILIEKEA